MSCRPTGIQLEQTNTGNEFLVAVNKILLSAMGFDGIELDSGNDITLRARELNAFIADNSHLQFNASLAIVSTNGMVIEDTTGISLDAPVLGFFGVAPGAAQPTVTGLKAGNAALGSLLTSLAALGLIVDSSGT
jgi:hypothetical protein